MSDEELLAMTSAARGLAHRAPFAEWSKDHKGHSSIVNHTSAWATNGIAFAQLADECDRRGLNIPSCDCPAGSHDQAHGAKDEHVAKTEIARLRERLKFAEISLRIWDEGRNSEYWIRYPSMPFKEERDDSTGILQDDLREMLVALGMDSSAQPRSPHEVFQSALAEMKRQLASSLSRPDRGADNV